MSNLTDKLDRHHTPLYFPRRVCRRVFASISRPVLRLSELYDAGVVRTPVDILRLKSRTSILPPPETTPHASDNGQGDTGTQDTPPRLSTNASVPHKCNDVEAVSSAILGAAMSAKGGANVHEGGAVEDDDGHAEAGSSGDGGEVKKKGKGKKRKAVIVPESTLEGRGGWGRLSAKNVFDAVEKSKDITLGR